MTSCIHPTRVRMRECNEGDLSIMCIGTNKNSVATTWNKRPVASRADAIPIRKGLLQIVAHNTSSANHLSDMENAVSL